MHGLGTYTWPNGEYKGDFLMVCFMDKDCIQGHGDSYFDQYKNGEAWKRIIKRT